MARPKFVYVDPPLVCNKYEGQISTNINMSSPVSTPRISLTSLYINIQISHYALFLECDNTSIAVLGVVLKSGFVHFTKEPKTFCLHQHLPNIKSLDSKPK